MKQLIEAVSSCKTSMPTIAREYKNQPNFAAGFDEAVRVLIGITVTKPELVNEIKREAILDLRINLEQKAINLRERIAVTERDANHLASSGKVKQAAVMDESLNPMRRELIDISTVNRYLTESI